MSNEYDEKVFRYWLCQTMGLGAVKIRELLHFFKSAEAVFRADREQYLQAFEAIRLKNTEEQRKSVLCGKDLENLLAHQNYFLKSKQEYENLKLSGTHFLIPEDEAYPDKLRCLYDMPQGIFYRGSLPAEDSLAAAIVGARQCSNYGHEVAFYLGKHLAMRGITVISGMADGVDGAAHRGAIEGIHACRNHEERNEVSHAGKTLAILGNGVDICYPRKNLDIYQELQGYAPDMECGGIMSEFGIGTKPLSQHFPMRNRLISAMADVVIVVEAKEKSGSLITADQALEQGKDVYVVPGRITDALSRGCNNLIAQGAEIITDMEDFINKVCTEGNLQCADMGQIKKNLAIHEEMVYSCLDFIPKHVGEILKSTQLERTAVLSALFQLQNMGLAKETTKNYYALKLT